MFSGLADFARIGLNGNQLKLKLGKKPPPNVKRRAGALINVNGLTTRSAGPAYWAHSLPVSVAVTFSMAAVCEQTAHTALVKLFNANTPRMPPTSGL